ncbi:hypothetical protein TNCV_402211 [Trichonephila clavipes]|nr:hypothetical protein TNCV_402211 [Trichonephila clavipes]
MKIMIEYWVTDIKSLRSTVFDDSLRWRDICRLEDDQSLAEETQPLQVARKWSPGRGINSKQVVLSPGRQAKVTTEHEHLHRIANWP